MHVELSNGYICIHTCMCDRVIVMIVIVVNKRVIDDCDEYVTLAIFYTINIFECILTPFVCYGINVPLEYIQSGRRVTS